MITDTKIAIEATMQNIITRSELVVKSEEPKERAIEKPLPIMNRRTEERTEYKKRSFKEKQAIKSLALEFMQKSSGQ